MLYDDGNGLAPVRSPFATGLHAVWTHARASVYVGDEGLVWQLIRTP